MKKFLRIKLPRSEREVPLALDAEILASAALQARALRRKRLAVKMALPGAVAAAAAVAVIVYGALNPVPVVNSGSSVIFPSNRSINGRSEWLRSIRTAGTISRLFARDTRSLGLAVPTFKRATIRSKSRIAPIVSRNSASVNGSSLNKATTS